MAEIERFYLARGIQFFLFSPALCMFKPLRGLHYVCCGASVVYHNGAAVVTSFVTNLGPYLVETAPKLHEQIEAASRENEKKGKKQVDKLEYPMELATAARLQWLSIHGVHYYIREGEGTFVRKLDGMGKGKNIYGNGFCCLSVLRLNVLRLNVLRLKGLRFSDSRFRRENGRL